MHPKDPEGWYIGQEFVEDEERILVCIKAWVLASAVISSGDFFLYGTHVFFEQDGNYMVISFKKRISARLFQYLQESRDARWIIGYVDKYLHRVNQELLIQRYHSGSFLLRGYSLFDILKLSLAIPDNDEVVLGWPPVFPAFPQENGNVPGQFVDETYINDLIDACGAFLLDNLDECIKRIITSVENFFRRLKLQGAKFPDGSYQHGFKAIVRNNLRADDYYEKILRDNLLFIYKLRNKMVHDKFHLKFRHKWICNKALGTLFYFYPRCVEDKGVRSYISSLEAQFVMLVSYCTGCNLDDIERDSRKWMSGQVGDNDVQVESEDDLEKFTQWLYRGISITAKHKEAVLRR